MMVTIARYLVVLQTAFFMGLTVVSLTDFRNASPTAVYALIGLQFAGVCVVASWRKKWSKK